MSKSASTSFIFANCKGAITNTINQIRRISNVETVTPVTDRLDLVIKLRTNEPTKAFNALERTSGIKNITNTQTALSFQSIPSGTSSASEESEQLIAYAPVNVQWPFQNDL